MAYKNFAQLPGKKIFGYPKFDGSGLGNLLWIWGKCFLWCKDHNVPLLAPNWIQIHPARILKLNPDLRLYWGYFTNKNYLKGWNKYYLLSTSHLIPFEELDDGDKNLQNDRQNIVIFSKLGNFTPFIGRHEEVYTELKEIINPRYLPDRSEAPFIAIHIRRGDFQKGTLLDIQHGKANLQVPLEWYIQALRALRKSIETSFTAIVFSDGSRDELLELLDEPRVKLSTEKNALKDLLHMSSSAALIASRSSFSLWASYLGQIPTLYYRGARPWYENIINQGSELELEWDEHTHLAPEFISTVNMHLSSNKN